MTATKFILILLITISCTSPEQDGFGYSRKFLDHFENSSTKVSSDSIIYPPEADNVIVRIPTYLKLNEEYIFKDSKGHTLKVQRLNYTDIEYELIISNQIIHGTLSLNPNFHLGAETIFIDQEMYNLTYYIEETDNSIIRSIGFGDGGGSTPGQPFARILSREIKKGENIDGMIMKLTP